MDLELRITLIKLAEPALVIALVAPLVLYAVAKYRAKSDPIPDPQLGLKLALYYFATLAFQVALAGGTLLIYSMIKKGGGDGTWPELDGRSAGFRTAFGLLVPAAIVLGAHVALILRTNDAQHPNIRRLFIALNLLLSGVAGFAGLIVAFQALFARGSSGGLGHLGVAMIVTYCTAWGLLGWRYHQLVLGPRGEPMPDVVLPPLATSSTPHAQVPVGHPSGSSTGPAAAGGSDSSNNGLPSLGGGAFPPIEPPK